MRKVVDLKTNKIIKCTPQVFRACWPEYAKDKTVLQDAKMLSVRGNNRDLMRSVNEFKKQWEDIIYDVNSGKRKDIYFLDEIEREVKKLNATSNLYPLNGDFSKYTLKNVLIGFLQTKDKKKTIESYRDAINSYTDFSSDDVSIFKITAKSLQKWTKWHENKGNSWKTIESYHIRLKAVLNWGVKKIDIYTSERFPYGDKYEDKYVLPKASPTTNIYLSESQIQKFKDYKCESPQEQRAKDVWFLMFYLGGCYPVDLLFSFQKSNFNAEKRSTSYMRSKTKDKIIIKKSVPIQLENDDAVRLVNKYLSRAGDKNLFMFHRDYGNNPLKNLKVRTNKYLSRINSKLGFEKILCANARHSCFNKLKSNGVPISEIMEIAGHTSLTTTQLYLDTLTEARLKDAYSKL